MQGVLIAGRRVADYFDRLSDSLTTFRTVLYVLLFYLAATCVLAAENKFPFTAGHILASMAVLVLAAKASNLLFGRLFNVPVNHESDIITGLILAFILTPVKDGNGYLVLIAAAAVAMLSKYVINWRGHHIFNPAAVGAVISGLVFHHYASWWIGNTAMAPILLLGGFLIVRKMRRFGLALSFVGFYLYFLFHSIATAQTSSTHLLYVYIAATPLLFFVPVMLTEPITSPTRQRNLIIYSLITAVFYSLSGIHRPPEEALLIGNVAAFLLEPNRSILLKFIDKRKEAKDIYSFLFSSPVKLNFAAGQYMEWTLPHTGVDGRGNRRYLTLASSPTEKELMFTIKLPERHSKFKASLMRLKPGQKIAAQRLAGSFTLKDGDQKVAFIAGGVGITPFRSIIKEIIDKNKSVDGVLLYSVRHSDELAFKDLFRQAEKVGLKTKYILSEADSVGCLHGYIDRNLIKEQVEDYKERLFYISGPQAFVAAVRMALLDIDVRQSQITTDFFPGYN